MKTFSIVLLATLLAFPSTGFSKSRHYHSSTSHGHDRCVSTGLLENSSRHIDLKGQKVIIRYDSGRPRRVVVNERHELRVDGNLIKLSADQQQLVGEFYENIEKLLTGAKEVGLEGAAIGAQGVEVAASAIAGAVSMLFTSYTSEDLERDVERKTATIEARANRLEAKADKLETIADQVEKLYEEMEESIPELRGEI